jgi:hypothetical protein
VRGVDHNLVTERIVEKAILVNPFNGRGPSVYFGFQRFLRGGRTCWRIAAAVLFSPWADLILGRGGLLRY